MLRFILTVFLACLTFGGRTIATAQQIPGTEAETVNGQKISFPAALQGHTTILVMSFSRDAGPGSDAWAAALASDPTFAALPVYRAAMLEAAPGFVRSLIRSSLRRQLAPSQQARYLLFSRDEKLWRAALTPTADKQPVVAILTPDGRLRWHAQGPPVQLLPRMRSELR